MTSRLISRCARLAAGIAACSVLLSACGGGGGNPPSPAAPSVTLGASPGSVTAGQTTTLTWSSTNATSCTASQGWSGTKATSGSETVGPLAATTTYALSCTGSGGTGSASATVNVGSSTGNVTVSGTITYQRIPFNTLPTGGLNFNNPVATPARGVVVEALNNASAVIVSTTTDAAGVYALDVPVNTDVRIRAKAQLLKSGSAPTWNFRVLNNTNGDALYVLDGTSFNSGSSATSPNHDLLATTGWNGTTYSSTRAAAPFAIIDTVYAAKELILTGNATTAFPALDAFWSATNRSAVGSFCPDTGNVGGTFYTGPGGTDDAACGSNPLPAGIYLLGDFANGNGDTDEFDRHVIAHEFGHYVEDKFSRSDSIGGDHTFGDSLDLRVAFGEGWGNAYSGMALNDPRYRDALGSGGTENTFDMEADNGTDGWYSELSATEILWDIFDSANESGDSLALGFAPIYAAMTGPQVTTDALTSIFSFAAALRSTSPAQSTAINALLSNESISGTDAFGSGETNSGGYSAGTVLPVYRDIALNGGPMAVCSRNQFGSEVDVQNKLGNRVFLRFVNDASHTIVVTAMAATNGAGTIAAVDPDIFVWRRGTDLGLAANGEGSSETTPQTQLTQGTYVIEVFDYQLSGLQTSPRCMTVSVTGN